MTDTTTPSGADLFLSWIDADDVRQHGPRVALNLAQGRWEHARNTEIRQQVRLEAAQQREAERAEHRAPPPPTAELLVLLDTYQEHLRDELQASEYNVLLAAVTLKGLTTFLHERDRSLRAGDVTPDDISGYLATFRWSEGQRAFDHLKTFFAWLARSPDIAAGNAMHGVERPRQPEAVAVRVDPKL